MSSDPAKASGPALVPAPPPLAEVVEEEATRSKRRRWGLIVVGLLAVAGVAAVVFYSLRPSPVPMPQRFDTAVVTRGEVTARVSATGRLEARSTVDVGAEVSGRIVEVAVDFDDHVQKGQLLARFKTDALAAQVKQADASVRAAKASLKQARVERDRAKRQLARTRRLHDKGIDSDAALDAAVSTKDLADATVLSAIAQVALQEASAELARTNLDNAEVYAPISGVVISRHVDPGQTVAAAFQTPVLFQIAEDLTKMRVIAAIDEADVGRTAVGQGATFTVDAFPGRSFDATVTELRSAPAIVQNVVTYDAILDVDNSDRTLKPGMTASVKIDTASDSGALLVPNAALRFEPPGREDDSAAAGVWILDGEELRRIEVDPGVSDGRVTAVSSRDLDPDARVITELTPTGRQAYGPDDGD